jgi:hypothetical protein
VPREQDDDDDKLDIQHRPTPGGLKTLLRFSLGPAPTLRAQQVEIKQRKPTGVGGGSKVRRDDCAGPAALSLADFFSTRGIFSMSRERVGRNSLDISMAVVGRVGASSVFIFYRARAPGGRSKVWGLFVPDRWPRRTHLFAHFQEVFFDAGLDRPASEKSPRNSGWGGGSSWLTPR